MTAPFDPALEPDCSYPAFPRGDWFSDEPEMETYRHMMQQLALIATLHWYWRGRTDYFIGGNLTIYYSATQKKSVDFRGPDIFIALDVDGTRERRSWMVWKENGRYPNVIIELLSDTTASNDRGEKKVIYEQTFRTPEYFLFDPYSFTLEGYRHDGSRYAPVTPDARGRLASAQLGMLLGVVDGELRLFERDGTLIAKPEEDAQAQFQRADEAQRRADDEHRRADAAEQHADQERRRAEAAELEVAKMREELRKLRGDG